MVEPAELLGKKYYLPGAEQRTAIANFLRDYRNKIGGRRKHSILKFVPYLFERIAEAPPEKTLYILGLGVLALSRLNMRQEKLFWTEISQYPAGRGGGDSPLSAVFALSRTKEGNELLTRIGGTLATRCRMREMIEEGITKPEDALLVARVQGEIAFQKDLVDKLKEKGATPERLAEHVVKLEAAQNFGDLYDEVMDAHGRVFVNKMKPYVDKLAKNGVKTSSEALIFFGLRGLANNKRFGAHEVIGAMLQKIENAHNMDLGAFYGAERSRLHIKRI